jgi:K+/H+ antiporter YhaU regulatory subunit KhtT
MIETEWMRIAAGSDLSGKSIAESEVRTKTGVSVVAVVREEEVIPSPDPDTKLEPGDVVGVLGTTGQRRSFRDTFGCVHEEMPAVQ